MRIVHASPKVVQVYIPITYFSGGKRVKIDIKAHMSIPERNGKSVFEDYRNGHFYQLSITQRR